MILLGRVKESKGYSDLSMEPWAFGYFEVLNYLPFCSKFQIFFLRWRQNTEQWFSKKVELIKINIINMQSRILFDTA